MRSQLVAEKPKIFDVLLESGDERHHDMTAFHNGKSGQLPALQRSHRIDTEREKITLGAVSTPDLVHAGNPARGAGKKPQKLIPANQCAADNSSRGRIRADKPRSRSMQRNNDSQEFQARKKPALNRFRAYAGPSYGDLRVR